MSVSFTREEVREEDDAEEIAGEDGVQYSKRIAETITKSTVIEKRKNINSEEDKLNLKDSGRANQRKGDYVGMPVLPISYVGHDFSSISATFSFLRNPSSWLRLLPIRHRRGTEFIGDITTGNLLGLPLGISTNFLRFHSGITLGNSIGYPLGIFVDFLGFLVGVAHGHVLGFLLETSDDFQIGITTDDIIGIA